MPLYEYRCKSCGNRYEKIQKVSDTPDTACPKCGGEVIRPLTAPALQFKGAGWYVNDYASKSSSSSSSDSEGGSKSESKSETKSDSKPAAETKSSSTSEPASKPAASPKSD